MTRSVMQSRRSIGGVAKFLLLFVLIFGLVNHVANGDHLDEQVLALCDNGYPLATIIDDASGRYPGTLLEVELEHEDGQIIYMLEILSRNGAVVELTYDACSGTVQEVREED